MPPINASSHPEPYLELMTRADVPDVHRLETTCFSAPWEIEAYYGEVDNPSAYYLVARREGAIVGFGGMWVVAGEAHVVTIATDPAHRRQGIGRLLMHGLLDEARHRAADIVSLEVRVSNTPAQTLYASLGFVPVARRRRYYPDTGEDALVMVLRLA